MLKSYLHRFVVHAELKHTNIFYSYFTQNYKDYLNLFIIFEYFEPCFTRSTNSLAQQFGVVLGKETSLMT